MREDTRLLSVIVPFFNEEDAIGSFFQRVIPILERIDGIRFEVICVNDGSKDKTLSRLEEEAERDHRVCIVDLSRNFGKEAALTAGIDESRGDIVIPIDADLQDPPELIPRLIASWREGYEVVLAKRGDRNAEGLLKRATAQLFYRFHNRIADVQIPENVGDFRLMARNVVEALKQMPERQRFMKGLFAWVGFRTTTLEFSREQRSAGKSKFSGWKLWNFALEGVTSFSTAPLRVWSYFGFVVSFLSILYGIYIIILALVYGIDVPGYASLLVAILAIGGVQLIGIGVLGEYIGRIYTETKARPIYIVRKKYSKAIDK